MMSEATFRGDLLEKLIETHSEEELRELCWRLGIEYEDLGGRGKRANARELIVRLDRRGRLDDLIVALRETRSDTEWPNSPAGREKATRGGAGEQLPIFSVPYRRNRNFSGREAQLLEIEQQLARGETTLAVAGLGGLGKTQLALEYCYRKRRVYELLYWLNADGAATLSASLSALAKALGLEVEEIGDQETVREWLFDWLGHTQARWLLIYDNADTMKPRELGDYLPRSDNGNVIITTRNPQFRAIAGVMELDLLEPNEAATFLQKRTDRDDQEGAEELAEALGNLPLALEHAALYVEETGTSFATYQNYFAQQRKVLWSELERPHGYHATIRTTWELSLELLQKQESAIQLLELCSFLAPEDIPLSLLRLASDPDVTLPQALQQSLENPLAIDRAIVSLQRYSLLVRDEDGLEMHRLVQTVMRDRMGKERAAEWAELAVSLLLAAFPEDPSMWHPWQDGPRLLVHAAVAAEHADQYGVERERVASLYNLTGYYLRLFGESSNVQPYLERALNIKEEQLGPDHPETAASLNNLGTLLQDIGKYEEARPYLERALAIRKKQLGQEHPDTAESLNNLGTLFRAMGLYEKARQSFEQALAIREKQQGAEHLSTATSLLNLGTLLHDTGEYEEARQCYKRALDIDEALLEPGHPRIATDLSNLGALLKDMRLYEEARLYHERALAIREKQQGEEHPSTATSLNNLGALLSEMGLYEEARPYFERALAIRKKRLGAKHPSTATSLNNLGMLLQRVKDYEKARLYLERALAIRDERLGARHPVTVASLNSLGILLLDMRNYEEARPYLEQALAIREEELGPEHPGTAESLNSMGMLLYYLRSYEKARRYLQRALTICERQLGVDHSQTRKIRDNLNDLDVLLRTQSGA